MDAWRLYAGGLVVAIAVSSLFFAPLLGLPAGATPSTGDSMGDRGPVLNVYADGEPDVGDVVVFETHDDSLTSDRTVHRVVADTDAGYVTQGDAEPITDQSVGVPHATGDRLEGVVVARVGVLEVAVLGAVSVPALLVRKKTRGN